MLEGIHTLDRAVVAQLESTLLEMGSPGFDPRSRRFLNSYTPCLDIYDKGYIKTGKIRSRGINTDRLMDAIPSLREYHTMTHKIERIKYLENYALFTIATKMIKPVSTIEHPRRGGLETF
jgi:hypothetical protein